MGMTAYLSCVRCIRMCIKTSVHSSYMVVPTAHVQFVWQFWIWEFDTLSGVERNGKWMRVLCGRGMHSSQIHSFPLLDRPLTMPHSIISHIKLHVMFCFTCTVQRTYTFAPHTKWMAEHQHQTSKTFWCLFSNIAVYVNFWFYYVVTRESFWHYRSLCHHSRSATTHFMVSLCVRAFVGVYVWVFTVQVQAKQTHTYDA